MAETNYETRTQVNLEEISAYIKNLKLKPVALGGVDKENVLSSIQEIYRMFSKVYENLVEQLALQMSACAQLQEGRAPLEEEIKKLKEEKASLSETVQQQLENSEKAADVEKKYRQREEEALKEVEDLRKKLLAQDTKIAEMQRTHQRELELAKVGASNKEETLEEIYLDARRSRTEMLEQARKTADDLIRHAEQEAEDRRMVTEQELSAQRQSVEQEIARQQEACAKELEEKRQACDTEYAEKQQAGEALLAKAETDAAQILQQAEATQAESQQHCQERENFAQKVVDDAEAEAKKIVEAARIAYLQERKKYDALLMQLGTLRAQTVSDIQADVSKLNELVFGMTGRGIETDTLNSAGLTTIDADEELAFSDYGEKPADAGVQPETAVQSSEDCITDARAE